MTDTELGKLVRTQAKELEGALLKPKDTEVFFSVALGLIAFARKMNGELSLKLPDVTQKSTGEIASWSIVVKKLES